MQERIISGDSPIVYEAVNHALVDLVGALPVKILDIGCGAGTLGRALKTRASHEIWGITFSEEEATLARQHLDRVIVADLNHYTPTPGMSFEVVICSHVLEHLYQPADLLRRLAPVLSPEGRLLVALPNILFWRQRLEFLCGRFRYTDGGLMDRTHFRFFDYATASHLPTEAGFRVLSSSAGGTLPMPVVRRFLPPPLAAKIDRWAVDHFPALLGFQFLLVCQKV